MYNQTVKNLEKEFRNKLAENQEEMLKTFFTKTLKPKPKYISGKLWLWLASFFIRLK